MQSYIVRVYRARPEDAGLASGIIEDIESGLKESFHNLTELQTMLADAIGKGQLGFPNFVPQEESDTYENIAVI
jgi:hypothetical protein